jgi:predicted Zn finger-like uncharacterized protein
MHVACPACEARYEVPDTLIGPGRRLRCARCAHEWLVQSSAAPPDRPPPAPGLQRQPQVPHPPLPQDGAARAGAGLWLAWLGSALVLGVGLAGLWLCREEVSAAWPPMARLYGWLGA